MTVEEALSCPWLHGLTAPSSQPLNLLTVDRMLHYARLTPLQRLLLNLAISCQPRPNPRKHLRRLFNDLVPLTHPSAAIVPSGEGFPNLAAQSSKHHEITTLPSVRTHPHLLLPLFCGGSSLKEATALDVDDWVVSKKQRTPLFLQRPKPQFQSFVYLLPHYPPSPLTPPPTHTLPTSTAMLPISGVALGAEGKYFKILPTSRACIDTCRTQCRRKPVRTLSCTWVLRITDRRNFLTAALCTDGQGSRKQACAGYEWRWQAG